MLTSQSIGSIKSTIDQAEYVCLFGVGILLNECFHQTVLFLGREPDLLCDNAPEKWGKEFFGIKCISPSELRAIGDETAVVITVKNYEQIFEQLYHLGLRDVFVSCYDRSYNTVQAIKRIERDPSDSPTRRPFINSVEGKWTLITGASRGIGRQIASAMAELGSNIIAHSRSVAHVKELIESTRSLGVQVTPIASELSDPNQVDKMLSELERLVPRIDIVFNSAAIPCSGGFWSTSAQDYLNCFTVNAVAPIHICQRLLPLMIKQGYGRVINITSSVEKRPETMPYACSKAALDKFVHDLAPSLAGSGVMLTLADPGWVRTAMTGFVGPNAVESVIPGILLGALLNGEINGRWFSAQDYRGLSIEAAMEKATFVSGLSPMNVQRIRFKGYSDDATE